jgi:hypothetical protein
MRTLALATLFFLAFGCVKPQPVVIAPTVIEIAPVGPTPPLAIRPTKVSFTLAFASPSGWHAERQDAERITLTNPGIPDARIEMRMLLTGGDDLAVYAETLRQELTGRALSTWTIPLEPEADAFAYGFSDGDPGQTGQPVQGALIVSRPPATVALVALTATWLEEYGEAVFAAMDELRRSVRLTSDLVPVD